MAADAEAWPPLVPQEGSAPLRALEFYSGIGGMHMALRRALQGTGQQQPQVSAAFDLNNVANDVYEHYFGVRPVQGTLAGMTAKRLDKYEAALWTLSPPCQPYTRQGHQKGSEDWRASSFLHLLALLPDLQCPPKYILVENVVGFEKSVTREELVKTLQESGYSYQEYICSPIQCGIPYSRPRYFMLAKQQPLAFARDFPAGTITMHPPILEEDRESGRWCVWRENHCRPVQEFLEEFKVPRETLLRWRPAMDVVSPSSLRCCCFTKSYHAYAKGTGSVLAHNDSDARWRPKIKSFSDSAESAQDSHKKELDGDASYVPDMRYFTPREVANIHELPADFTFPDSVTLKQRYALLGNGISVTVVAALLRYLVSEPTPGLLSACSGEQHDPVSHSLPAVEGCESLSNEPKKIRIE